MSFDLQPRHSAADWFHAGSFWWGWLLEHGAGWPLNCGAGIMPGQYVWTEDRSRRDGTPFTNDGYRVTAKEAKEMARLARYIAAQERRIAEVYAQLPEHRRQAIESAPLLDNTYRRPVRADFIDLTERFAEWAERSGGFRIK